MSVLKPLSSKRYVPPTEMEIILIPSLV